MTNWQPVTRPWPASWWLIRLWWAYLQDYLWNYILTNSGDRVIVIVPWGDLPINTWNQIIRPWASSWDWRPII